MFSSNPFSSSTNSFSDHEKYDAYFNENSFMSGDFNFHSYNTPSPPPPPRVTTEDFTHQPQQQFCEDHDEVLDSVINRYKNEMPTPKNGGKSKIYTAQGPRDRRVRLSINISRKFFYLQDLLGFVKASKTLDWLFSKSLTAIKDLVKERKYSSSSNVSTDQSKEEFLETIYGVSEDDNGEKKKSVCKIAERKTKKRKQRCKTGFQDNLARDQSRTEPRARARERTQEKLRVKTIDDNLKALVPDGYETGCWRSEQPAE